MRTGEPFLMEYRYLAKDGSVVWVLDHASLIARSDAGDPSSFQGVMLDITSRKEAESKAAAAEDRYRTLTERGPVVAYSFELVYTDGGRPLRPRLVRQPAGRGARPTTRSSIGSTSPRSGSRWCIRTIANASPRPPAQLADRRALDRSATG